jgi:hypothetical protein
MKRRWNHWLTGGFLLTLAAFLSYFMFFVRFPITRDVPWVNLLLFAGALVLLGIGLKRAYGQPESYRGKILGPILTFFSLAILGLFLVSNFWLSRQLPASKNAPAVGQRAPDFTLPDADGKPVTLSKLFGNVDGGKDQWVLLVFYRGYW